QISPKKYGKVDWSTDLFQLGTVFYEMLTGVNPFMAEDPAEVISNILYTDVEPPSSLNPNIPGGLDEIVMRALTREKKERWRSTDVMYDRLKEMLK
ncbi:MAG: serine/threonine protein kinase, partial [Candidatus Thermoplasmatota archaeon]|nr:serine/threonine protein kinase [Candidatus Thermoplasmatota archaeon]